MHREPETVTVSATSGSRSRVAIRREGDKVVVVVPDRFDDNPEEFSHSIYDWVRRHRGTVVFDFSACRLMHSPVIAWLFQVIQAGRRDSAFAWSSANGQVQAQLRQYHLDAFLHAV